LKMSSTCESEEIELPKAMTQESAMNQRYRHGEETPAYQILMKHGLINSSFRIEGDNYLRDQLGAIEATSNPFLNTAANVFGCPCKCLFQTFTTSEAQVQPVTDGRGKFLFYGPGNHLICDPFYRRVGESRGYSRGEIIHGDKTVVVVEQGKIGFALDRGQPILLPPGLHYWRSPTLRFKEAFDLNNNVINMPPLTLVTVDEGYAAVSEDNGRQVILEGGDTYLLTHRNWKFQKFISQKIQSNDLKRILATSADNVLMSVDATVIWKIENVAIAAKNSAETIHADGSDTKKDNLGDIKKLSNDVLKQAEASLAAFIGCVNYSDTFNVAAAVQHDEAQQSNSIDLAAVGEYCTEPVPSTESQCPAGALPQANALFDQSRISDVRNHANTVTRTYGVHIISINVVAAVPADEVLQSSLAQGAVAAAEAQKFEVVARGQAAAEKIRARGESQAKIIRAEGDRRAAELVEGSTTAVNFAMLEKTGEVCKQFNDKSTFFFGNDVKDLSHMFIPAAAKML